MRALNRIFTCTVLCLLLLSTAYGQSEKFNWIKPTEVQTKNYKLARKLYRQASYDAGYLSIDYEQAKKLFSGKSGIGIESIPTAELLKVPLWQSETYKHKVETEQLAGSITSVQMRRELFKSCKSKALEWKMLSLFNDRIEIPLRPKHFSVATFGDSKDTIRNLVIIRKGEICKIQPFQNYDGGLFLTPFPEIEFQFSRRHISPGVQIITKHTQDTISFKLYYGRNETELSKQNEEIILAHLECFSDSIVSIEVTGFASVEGKYESNQKLYASRVNCVLEKIRPHVSGEFEMNVRSQENWPLFKSQINGTDLEYLTGMSKEQVRDYVNRNALKPEIEGMLEEQRYVEVKVILVQSSTDEIVPASTIEYYNHLAKEFKSKNNRIGTNELKKLEYAQINAFTEYLNGNLSYDDINQLEIPGGVVFMPLLFNKLVLNHRTRKTQYSNKWFFNQLLKMGVEKKTPIHLKTAVRFNTQLLLYQAVQEGTLSYFLDLEQMHLKSYRDYIFKLIPASSSTAKSKELDDRLVLDYLPAYIKEFKNTRLSLEEEEQLYRFYYTQMISSYYLYFYPETKHKAHKQLSGIYNHFAEDKISSNEERISIARLYMLFQKWDKAISTLRPLLDEPVYRIYATQLTLSCRKFLLSYEGMIEEILSSKFDLGYDAWVEMFEKPGFLGPRYFDNARIREYYYAR